jgi:prepilin-type N-terminal cleavage/methylation domain-containing protein
LSDLRRHLALAEGFTPVELLVVMAIIGVLLTIVVPSYLGYRGRAASRVAQSDLRAALPAAEVYGTDHNADYTGLDVTKLRSRNGGLAASIDHVVITGSGSSYCLGATVDGSSWSIQGPGAGQWFASDDCSSGTEATP